MKIKFLFFNLLFLPICAFAQPANTCPVVNAGPDQTICGGCTNLTQTFLPVNATTGYSVASVPYLPYSYTTDPNTGGIPASGLPTSIDDYWGPVLNIGFCFQYYGNTYTQCIMGSNGGVSFNIANANLYNTWPISAPIPSATPTDMWNTIMGPWHDIYPAILPPSGTSDLYYYTTGTAPCRKFVAIWHNCPMFSCTTLIDQQEIVLYETTNIIEVYIQNKPLCAAWNGGLAVLGIQNSTGTAAVTVAGRNATAWSATNEGWRFTPNGAPLYTLQWLQGATLLGTTATVNVCPAATTTYTAQETITTCAGPVVVSDAVIVNVSGGTPVAVNSSTICSGGSTTLTATPGVGGGTYSWAPGGQTTASITVSPGATTVYTVTYTLAGCVSTGTGTVTVNPTPTVTVPANITACAGTTVAASAYTSTPGGGTFTWTNSNPAIGLGASGVGNAPSFTATNAGGAPISGTITVTPTVAGCPGTPSTYTITINPLPTITVNSPTVCPSATATLTAAGGTTYSWTAGLSATTGNPVTGSPAVTTSYTVTGTTAGCSSTAVATITIGGSVTVTVNSPTICAGATAVLTAVGGTTYLWNTGSTANPYSVTPAVTTVYTVTGTSGGCTGNATSTVTVNPLPTVTAPANITVCNNGAVAASAYTSAPAGATFAWTNSNPTIGLAAAGAGNTPAFTATNAGTAAVTATITVTPTLAGCTGPSSTYTITVNPTPTVVVPANTTTCSGTVVAASAYTSPVAGTTFAWTNSNPAIGLAAAGAGNQPAFTATNAGTAPVTATITVTPTANGCPGPSATYTITVNPIPTVTVPANISLCAGATVPASAYTSPVAGATYAWTNSDPTIGIPAAGAGNIAAFTATNVTANPVTATITVTPTANGCTGPSSTYTITVNTAPSVVVPANTTICDGGAVAAGVFTSASAGATFAWTNSAPSIGLAAAGAGNQPAFTVTNVGTTPVIATITVTPSAAGGCPAVSSSYTITVNPTPTVVVPANITVCNGSPIATTSFTSPVAGTTYSWTNSNTTIGIPASGTGDIAGFNGTNITAAPVTATITVTPSANGCSGPASTYTITVNPTPTVVVPANIAVCVGTNIAASVFTSPVAGTTFAWTNSNTSIGLAAAGAGNVPAFTGTNAGVTPLVGTITVTPSANGCTGTSSTYTITINPSLIVNAGLDDSICSGGSTVISVTPNGVGYTYNWTPAASLSSATVFNPTASPATTTTYNVTVTDINGCTGTDNVIVNVDAPISLTAIAGFNITCHGACDGQTIVIPAGGSGTFTYLWTSGCTTASCTGLCPGSYSVTVTDTWGCTATNDTSITEPTLLTASSTQIPTSCNGVCDATATATGAGGTFPYTYSWNTVPVQPTATAINLCAGTYICTVKDANNCTTTVSVTILQPTPVVIAPIANDTICFGGTATILASASGGNTGTYTYTWTPAGTGGTTSSVTVNPVTTTNYGVSATDVNGCPSNNVPITITVNPPLALVATGTDSICPGASTPLLATASGGNPLAAYTYSWSPAAGLNNAAIANPMASPAVTTVYTVTVNDGCSPTVTASVTVKILPLPTIVFSASALSGCSPLCVNFNDMTTVTFGNVATWNWNFGSGVNDTSTSQNPTHCFVNPASYDITLTATSNNGCVSTLTNTAMITVFPNPVASFTAPLSTSIINPTVPFTDMSTGAVLWNWNFGDAGATPPANNLSVLQNPSHTYGDVGTYCVTLAITSINGCVDTTTLCVVIDPEFTFFVPNAFSPNGDGINDEFFGKGDFITDFDMKIFDRWGNLLFFADDINKHWDGKANHGSDIAQQDVYVYVINLKDFKGMKHKYIGSVTIVK